MNLTVAVAATALTLVSIVQADSNYYNAPVSNLVPGNNLSDAAIETSLLDTQYPVSKALTSNTVGMSSIVPKGSKTYIAGLRVTIDGTNHCSASLITPTHLLVGTYCMPDNIRWASIGSHYVNGTQDGEQIKVVAVLNHPHSSNLNFSSDLAVVVLAKPSSFKPVALAAADGSDEPDGALGAKLGWQNTGGAGTNAYELMRQNVQLISNEKCSNETFVDDTLLCSSGAANVTSCTGDYGGPVVVERSTGDVVVGVITWGNDCGTPGYPSMYTRVSKARSWIESVASGVCFH